MSEFAKLPGGEFVIRGDLDRNQVPELWQQREMLWPRDADTATGADRGAAAPLSLSLREVGQADTAGLALLVALQAEARQRDIELVLLDLPSQLKAAAKLSQLDTILSTAADSTSST